MKAKATRLLCSIAFIIIAAFIVRVAIYYPYSVRYDVPIARDGVPFGSETGAVAAAIAQGRGFSSPLRMVQTGPTAWFAPIFPYLLAGIFKLFGVFSYKSNLVIHFLDIAFSAFTCWPLAAIGSDAFGKKTAIAAAWTWVFLPTAIFFPVVWVWDTSLAALWMAMLVAATLKIRGSNRLSWWIGYGALWSLGAMINPSLVSVLPFLGLWAIWPLRKQVKQVPRCARDDSKSQASVRVMQPVAAAALVFAIGILPWTIRNYVVFHRLIPLRSNFGLELWLGNNPQVPDSWTWWLHPNDDIGEAQKYASMTEIPYMDQKSAQAWEFIRSHPLDTARFAFHRFVNHWLGIWDAPADIWPTAPWYMKLTIIQNCIFALAAWMGALFAYRAKRKAANPLLVMMLIFPMAFYLTHTSLRYRFPMDPVMLVLSTFAVVYAFSPAAQQMEASSKKEDANTESAGVLAEEPVAALR